MTTAALSIAPAQNQIGSIAAEVLAGLAQSPKQISPKYFYDQKGSELFDAITNLDEYYLPEVEKQIFSEHLDAICAAIGTGKTLVEPGAGSCEKVKWLLPELQPAAYVPMDISGEHLQASAAGLRAEFPDIEVTPQVCDHTRGIRLDQQHRRSPAVFFYPGSSVGNFEPHEAVEFMRAMRARMDADGGLLIGVDTKKDRDVLHAAYDDSAGVTAEFNANILNNLNHLLDGDLDTNKFEHHVIYNEARGRIEMHLRCTERHTACLAGERIRFAADELVHTENSYKYHPEEFIRLAEQAGFTTRNVWQDARGWFAVMYFVPA